MTDATVNRDEMARLLRVSPPTLTKMLKDYPDLPVASGGSRGVPYEFDAEAVIAWRREKVEQAKQAATERDELIAQFEFLAEPDEPSALAQTPAQRVQIAKAIELERKLARDAGQLVDTASIRQALQIALTVLGKRLDNMPAQIGRKYNLPEPVQREMRREIDEMRSATVRDIKAAIGAHQAEEADQLDAAE